MVRLPHPIANGESQWFDSPFPLDEGGLGREGGWGIRSARSESFHLKKTKKSGSLSRTALRQALHFHPTYLKLLLRGELRKANLFDKVFFFRCRT